MKDNSTQRKSIRPFEHIVFVFILFFFFFHLVLVLLLLSFYSLSTSVSISLGDTFNRTFGGYVSCCKTFLLHSLSSTPLSNVSTGELISTSVPIVPTKKKVFRYTLELRTKICWDTRR